MFSKCLQEQVVSFAFIYCFYVLFIYTTQSITTQRPKSYNDYLQYFLCRLSSALKLYTTFVQRQVMVLYRKKTYIRHVK